MKHAIVSAALVAAGLTTAATAADNLFERTLADNLTPEKLQQYYRDLDDDRVIDDIDQCPNSKHPDKVNRFGCIGDQDQDGVSDALDQCPDTPANTRVNAVGCAMDDDKDGVANFMDACPDTPEGTRVNEQGCAPISRIVLNLNFDTGKYDLKPEHKAKINEALRKLPDLDENTALLIEGYTDNVGCRDDNVRLSWNRAEAVRAYIESKLGKEARNLFVIGYGPDHPIASNKTASGRAQNRRIELKVVPMEKLPSEASPMIPAGMKGYVPRPGRCKTSD